MVKIRLRRMGAKKQPSYRVVVQDSRAARDGKFIEVIGNYNPRTEPPTLELDAERAVYWLGVGAQASEAVRRMFDKLGILSQATLAHPAEPAAPAVIPPLAAPLAEADELPAAEEDEELELDLFEETDEAEDADEEWEPEGEPSDEVDDLDEEDWEADVEDDEEETDDDPIEDDE